MFHTIHSKSVVDLFNRGHIFLSPQDIYTVAEYYHGMRKCLNLKEEDKSSYEWLRKGVKGEILEISDSSNQWKDCLFRIQLGFEPNDSSIVLPVIEAGWRAASDDSTASISSTEDDLMTDRTIFLVQELEEVLRRKLSISNPMSYSYLWFNRGIPCKALIPETSINGWINGLIRLQIEFKYNLALPSSSEDDSLNLIRNSI